MSASSTPHFTSLLNKKPIERKLRKTFFKLEDAQQKYQPIVYETDFWPRIDLDTPVGHCPFICSRDEHKERERMYDDLRRGMYAVKRRNREKRIKRNIPYCECCHMQLSNLDVHLESEEHTKFVSNQDNYSEVSDLIEEVNTGSSQYLDAYIQQQLQMQSAINKARDEYLASNLIDTSKEKGFSEQEKENIHTKSNSNCSNSIEVDENCYFNGPEISSISVFRSHGKRSGTHEDDIFVEKSSENSALKDITSMFDRNSKSGPQSENNPSTCSESLKHIRRTGPTTPEKNPNELSSKRSTPPYEKVCEKLFKSPGSYDIVLKNFGIQVSLQSPIVSIDSPSVLPMSVQNCLIENAESNKCQTNLVNRLAEEKSNFIPEGLMMHPMHHCDEKERAQAVNFKSNKRLFGGTQKSSNSQKSKASLDDLSKWTPTPKRQNVKKSPESPIYVDLEISFNQASEVQDSECSVETLAGEDSENYISSTCTTPRMNSQSQNPLKSVLPTDQIKASNFIHDSSMVDLTNSPSNKLVDSWFCKTPKSESVSQIESRSPRSPIVGQLRNDDRCIYKRMLSFVAGEVSPTIKPSRKETSGGADRLEDSDDQQGEDWVSPQIESRRSSSLLRQMDCDDVAWRSGALKETDMQFRFAAPVSKACVDISSGNLNWPAQSCELQITSRFNGNQQTFDEVILLTPAAIQKSRAISEIPTFPWEPTSTHRAESRLVKNLTGVKWTDECASIGHCSQDDHSTKISETDRTPMSSMTPSRRETLKIKRCFVKFVASQKRGDAGNFESCIERKLNISSKCYVT